MGQAVASGRAGLGGNWHGPGACEGGRIVRMSIRGASVVIKGEVRSSADLSVEGRVEGKIICDGLAVTLLPAADVAGDVLARDITVSGRCEGQLVASEVIDIRADADVSGRLITDRLIINDGARFNGHVEPQHLEAALRVAKFNRQKEAAGKR